MWGYVQMRQRREETCPQYRVSRSLVAVLTTTPNTGSKGLKGTVVLPPKASHMATMRAYMLAKRYLHASRSAQQKPRSPLPYRLADITLR